MAVGGQTMPEIRELMEDGKRSAVESVTYYMDRFRRYDVDKLNPLLACK